MLLTFYGVVALLALVVAPGGEDLLGAVADGSLPRWLVVAIGLLTALVLAGFAFALPFTKSVVGIALLLTNLYLDFEGIGCSPTNGLKLPVVAGIAFVSWYFNPLRKLK